MVLLLAVYNLSRGFADNGATPHAYELIVADRVMFGWATGGEVPTVWLQQHLYRPEVHWWDVLVSWVYFSHFVVTLAAAAVLWLRSRARWGAYMRRWGFLCAAGLVTYFGYPAAPPWWAAQNGLLTEVARISTRGWKEFGMHGAGNLLNAGQIASNPVAAMPSLHTAWALFVVLFFLRSIRRRWWPLLLAYPLAMTFTLVYSGEHYVIDVLVGWAYVGMTFLVVGLAERAWRARRRRRAGPVPATSASARSPRPSPRSPSPLTGRAGLGRTGQRARRAACARAVSSAASVHASARSRSCAAAPAPPAVSTCTVASRSRRCAGPCTTRTLWIRAYGTSANSPGEQAGPGGEDPLVEPGAEHRLG